MSPLDAVEWEAPLLEPVDDPEAERDILKTLAFMPYALRVYLDTPWFTRCLVSLETVHLPLRHVSPELCELIALVVSQDNSCRHCYEATRLGLKVLGFPDDRIRRLEESLLSAGLSPSERAALELARTVSRAIPVAHGRDAEALLASGMPPEGVREVAFLAAVNVFFNRTTTLPALPPTQPLEENWLERSRRLVGARLWPQARTDTPLAPAERTGPFASLVAAMDGLPAARRLRDALDAAFGATTLGGRARALIFAVVARGLGCSLCGDEAGQLLLAEGLTVDEVEHVLAHLSGPMLDPLEQAAVAIARESIWYRPAHIQRQVRAVRPLFSRTQLVDLVGFVALANMVGRLGLVTELATPAA